MGYPQSVPRIPGAVAAAYSLCAREQQVCSLVLQGFSTRDLVARVFRDHYVPRL